MESIWGEGGEVELVGCRASGVGRPADAAPASGVIRRPARARWRPGSAAAALTLPVALLLMPPFAARAQPPEPQEDAASRESPALLDVWTRAWTPGRAHSRLASRAGFWKLTTRTWGDLSEEPVVTETTAVREMVLGGRVLQEEVVGEVQGLELQSLGYLGYDNVTHRWWSLWMDTLSTAPVFTTGTEDPGATVLVLSGEYADPLSGRMRPVRTVVRFVDYDTERFEWWETRDGEEVKTMDILYQRQGPFQLPGPLVDPER